LGPVVSMAGLALDRSLALTRAGQAPRATSPPAVVTVVPDPRTEAERDALRSRCETLAAEGESARREAAERRGGLGARAGRFRALEDAPRGLGGGVAELRAEGDAARAALEDERARSAALDAAARVAEADARQAEARAGAAEAKARDAEAKALDA